MAATDQVTGARITLRRRLAWHEMDPAGHNHFASALRWLEETEHTMWRELGLLAMIPRLPRVRVELDYRDRIWLAEVLEVTVGVVSVGTSSCTLALGVEAIGEDGARRLCVEGRYVIALTGDTRSGPAPWPEEVRDLLEDPSSVLDQREDP